MPDKEQKHSKQAEEKSKASLLENKKLLILS